MLLLLIETSSMNCSVALCDEHQVLASIEKCEQNVHASFLTLYINEVLTTANKKIEDIDAIAVGKGPGSYTGLRIGVSTAKGLCYSLDKPLISCNSLNTLFIQAKEINHQENAIYCPLIDARRMEVYSCMMNANGESLSEISAIILNEQSYEEILKENKMIFFGDGAEKTKSLFTSTENIEYIDNLYPSAIAMREEAVQKYRSEDFEDVAYFEPYYLKEFFLPTKK